MAVSVGTAGAGAVSTNATSVSWSHTVAADDNLVVVVVAYPDGTSTISATYDGSAMTLRGRGYRLAVFTAPSATSGAKTLTASTTGAAWDLAANSLTFKSASYGSIVINPASASSNDGGNHAATGTAASGGMLMFCVGQAYGSAQPTFTNATAQFWSGLAGYGTSAGAATAAGTGSPITMSCTTGQWGSSAALVLASPVTASAATTATATPSADVIKTVFTSAAQTATAAGLGGALRTANVAATTAATATTSGTVSRGQSLAAALAATVDTGTATPLYNVQIGSSLLANILQTSGALRTANVAASLISTHSASANLTENTAAQAALTVTAGPAAVLASSQIMQSSGLTAVAVQSGTVSRPLNISATGITAQALTSGTLLRECKVDSDLTASASTTGGMVKGQTLSGSLIAQATSGAGAVESTAAGAALTATATGLAGLISGKKIQAALSLTATADASGIATSQREIIYVYADDRKAVVEATNRKSYIEKFSNNVVVTYEVRKVSVAASRKFTVND